MKILNKCIFLMILFAILYAKNVQGQQVTLKGKIVDDKTKEPLPYATIEIYNLKTGTVANAQGEFELSAQSDDSKRDTIQFSFLGYKKVWMSINDFEHLNKKVIQLSQNAVHIKEVVVTPKKYKTLVLGVKQKEKFGCIMSPGIGHIEGIYLENPKKDKIGWIKSVSFYIYPYGHHETPFRIRIYDVDKDKKCPGNDILNQNLIVAAQNAGWFRIDLSKYNIRIPQEGMFVMMEWFYSDDKYFVDQELNINGKKIKQKGYGQSLGCMLVNHQVNNWHKYYGNTWILEENRVGSITLYAINAEVNFAK